MACWLLAIALINYNSPKLILPYETAWSRPNPPGFNSVDNNLWPLAAWMENTFQHVLFVLGRLPDSDSDNPYLSILLVHRDRAAPLPHDSLCFTASIGITGGLNAHECTSLSEVW